MWAVPDVNHHDYGTLRASGNPSPSVAAPLLDRCWPAVVRLAQVLDERGVIGEGGVIRAPRIPPGAAGDRYVSELRSGYRSASRVTRAPLREAIEGRRCCSSS